MRSEALEKLAYARRKVAALKAESDPLPFLRDLFDKQLQFVTDQSRWKSALCPRRAGKTTLVPAYAFAAALRPEMFSKRWESRGVPAIVRYWAISEDRAEELMWEPLKRFAQKWGIPCRFDNQKLTVYLANGNQIRLVGADKEKESHKKRGDGVILELVDECSVYGEYLRTMVIQVMLPSAMDFGGSICLFGTPGVAWRGFWFEVTGPEEAFTGIVAHADEDAPKRQKGWSRHAWDSLDNPFIDAAAELAQIREDFSLSEDDPAYMREYRGKWVRDTGGLFYAWDVTRNQYEYLPRLPKGAAWEYSLGWDLGKDKNQALMVWAFSKDSKCLWEVYSRQGFRDTVDVAERVRQLDQELGGIPFKVADLGGLGVTVVEDFQRAHGIVFEGAKKTDKKAFHRRFNEELRRGIIKTRKGSVLTNELSNIPKSLEKPDEPDPRFQDHVSDAALYSWRRAWHWDGAEPQKGKEGTRAAEKEWVDSEELEVIAAIRDAENGIWAE